MKISLRLIFLLALPGFVNAQSIDSIQKRFPGEETVMQNLSTYYTISIRDNQPYVESEESHQIKYLSTHAAGYLSQYGFWNSDFQQVVKYEAYTLTAENKKLKVSEFKTNNAQDASVFYDDVKQTSFDFPAISPGAVGNLQLSRRHKDPHFLSPFFFARHIPVLHSELRIRFPKDMTVKYRLMGNDTSQVRVTKDSKRGDHIYSFQYINCPANRRYADAPDNSWFATQVVFYIESYKNDNGEIVPFLSNPDDLYQLNYSFIKDINKEVNPATRKIVDSLTKNARSDEEKARNIYSWVQQNIKYVAFEEGMEGFIPREANLICSRRFGDCKDMSSILTVMMKTAGIPAYYTWIGTRHLSYQFSTTPLPMVSNHMICTILLNGRYIFLDGTHPTCIFGIPPDGIQDKEAMIALGEKEYKIVKIPVSEKSQNVLTDSTFLELTDRGLRGKITEHSTGYFSMDQHAMLHYIDAGSLMKRMRSNLSRGSNKFQLDSVHFTNTTDLTKIELTADFSLPDYAKKIGNEWYLNLNLFKFFEHQEIDFPKRQMPIEFDFKFIKKYVIALKIPDGYQVSYMPKGKSYHNDIWGFDLQYQQKDNWLILTQQFDNDFLLMKPGQFSDWNKVLENLFPLYKETVSISPK